MYASANLAAIYIRYNILHALTVIEVVPVTGQTDTGKAHNTDY